MTQDTPAPNSSARTPEQLEEDRRRMDQIADEMAHRALSREKNFDHKYSKVTAEGPGSVTE